MISACLGYVFPGLQFLVVPTAIVAAALIVSELIGNIVSRLDDHLQELDGHLQALKQLDERLEEISLAVEHLEPLNERDNVEFLQGLRNPEHVEYSEPPDEKDDQ